MTVQEYMSPQRFPLTTQIGLRPDQQMLIDAQNYDEFEEALKGGGTGITPEEAAIGRELYEKMQSRDEVLAQLGVPPPGQAAPATPPPETP